MKKVLSFFKSWEFFLICLLALTCIVFNVKDSANLAAGLSKKDVFNFANIIKSLRPYMLYSFMTLGMMLILALGDMDISVGAVATLSVVVLAVLYRAFTTGGMANPIALCSPSWHAWSPACSAARSTAGWSPASRNSSP